MNNYLEDKESSNVIGVIKGQVEPDRYVIIGTSLLAWTLQFLNIKFIQARVR